MTRTGDALISLEVRINAGRGARRTLSCVLDNVIENWSREASRDACLRPGRDARPVPANMSVMSTQTTGLATMRVAVPIDHTRRECDEKRCCAMQIETRQYLRFATACIVSSQQRGARKVPQLYGCGPIAQIRHIHQAVAVAPHSPLEGAEGTGDAATTG